MVHVCKIHLLPSSFGKQEIRRITVTSDVANSFSLLTEKIVKLFPLLSENKFTIMWKDDEQDDIIMSSDEELSQAIANSEFIMKIFVSVHDDAKPAPEKKEEVFDSIVCDGCEAKIKGCRYKCLECPDYDLCSKCNYEDKHPNHNMIKYCSPNSVPYDFTADGSGQADFLRFMNPHGYPWKCPGRKNGGRRRFCGRNKPHWENGFPFNGNAHDFLKNIGESVSNLLDPLGIDVSVDVVPPSNTPEEGIKKEPTCKAGPSSEKEASTIPEFKAPSENTKVSDANEATENMYRAGSASQTSSSSCVFTKVHPEFKTNGLFVPQTGPFQYNFGTSAASSESTIKEDCSTNNPHNRTYPVIEEVIPKLVEDSKPTTQAERDISGMTAEIAAKVASMLEMGFSNNGGWLQRLLEAKNGSIPDTLEYLYPNYPRN